MKKILLPHQYYYPHMDLFKDKSTQEKEKDFLNILDSNAPCNKEAMVYVHIPFCDSKCMFCGFDKAYNIEETGRYVEKLCEEIEFFSKKRYIKDLKVIGLHFGGGTPTILPLKDLETITDKVTKNFNISEKFVINIEGSATTLYKDDIIQFLKEKNVSRVSIGVQTFYEKLRKEYNLKASLEEVYLTISKLNDNKIMKYIDIMYGYPDFGVGDPVEIVISGIKKSIELGVEGIDFGQIVPFYNKLEKRIQDEGLKYPTTKDVVTIIENSTRLMEAAGYTQETCYGYTKGGTIIVETSYYGGEESMPDCIAVGSSAFGLLNGYKYRNISYKSYMMDSSQKFSQLKKLTDFERDSIHIAGFPKLLKLSKNRIKEEMKSYYKSKFDYLINEGLVGETEDLYYLTQLGKCFVDNVYIHLLDENEQKLISSQLKILTLD